MLLGAVLPGAGMLPGAKVFAGFWDAIRYWVLPGAVLLGTGVLQVLGYCRVGLLSGEEPSTLKAQWQARQHTAKVWETCA